MWARVRGKVRRSGAHRPVASITQRLQPWARRASQVVLKVMCPASPTNIITKSRPIACSRTNRRERDLRAFGGRTTPDAGQLEDHNQALVCLVTHSPSSVDPSKGMSKSSFCKAACDSRTRRRIDLLQRPVRLAGGTQAGGGTTTDLPKPFFCVPLRNRVSRLGRRHMTFGWTEGGPDSVPRDSWRATS